MSLDSDCLAPETPLPGLFTRGKFDCSAPATWRTPYPNDPLHHAYRCNAHRLEVDDDRAARRLAPLAWEAVA